MKKSTFILIIMITAAFMLSACGGDKNSLDTENGNQTPSPTGSSSETASTTEAPQNIKVIETRVVSVNCPEQWDRKLVERKVEVDFIELYKVAEGEAPAKSSQIEIAYEPAMDWQTQFQSIKSSMQNIHKDSAFEDIKPVTAGDKTYRGFQGSGKVTAIYLFADFGTGSCNVFLDLKNGSAVNDADILAILASIQIK